MPIQNSALPGYQTYSLLNLNVKPMHLVIAPKLIPL